MATVQSSPADTSRSKPSNLSGTGSSPYTGRYHVLFTGILVPIRSFAAAEWQLRAILKNPGPYLITDSQRHPTKSRMQTNCRPALRKGQAEMNVLPMEKQVQIVSALAEGTSARVNNPNGWRGAQDRHARVATRRRDDTGDCWTKRCETFIPALCKVDEMHSFVQVRQKTRLDTNADYAMLVKKSIGAMKIIVSGTAPSEIVERYANHHKWDGRKPTGFQHLMSSSRISPFGCSSVGLPG